MRAAKVSGGCLVWAALASQIAAQVDLAFTWGFLNGESSLHQCDSIAIQIVDVKDSTEPYYMFTYPLNSSASPVITTYGTGETNNMTLAPYEPGTEIVLGLVDAFGASGGWTATYKIEDGSDSCANDLPSSTPLDVQLNTTEVGTCGTVGVSIENGQAPYTLTAFPIGSPLCYGPQVLADKLPRTDSVAKTFNITTSSSDSYIAFVNNLGANLHIGFGIRDNEGNWATTAGPVWTFGQSQDCDNSSRSMAEAPSDDEGGDSSGPGNDGSDAHNGGDGGSSTGAVVGGVVGGIAVAAALALGLAWYLGWCCFPGKRKKNNGNETGDGPSYAANHGGQGNYSPRPNSANAFLNNDPYGRSSGQGSGYAGPLPTHSRSSFETANRPMSQVSSGYNQQMGGFRLANPDNPDTEEALYPPSAAYTQPMHSRHESWDSVGSHRSHSQFPSNPSSEGQFMGSPRQSQMPAGLDDEVPMSVSEKTAALMAESGQHRGSSRQVMQHTDGGPAPSSSQAQDHEELPPAYAGLRLPS